MARARAFWARARRGLSVQVITMKTRHQMAMVSAAMASAAADDISAFLVANVLLMERGPIFVLQRSGAYANDTPRGGPVPAALGTAGLVGTSIKVAVALPSKVVRRIDTVPRAATHLMGSPAPTVRCQSWHSFTLASAFSGNDSPHLSTLIHYTAGSRAGYPVLESRVPGPAVKPRPGFVYYRQSIREGTAAELCSVVD